jgi:hypothetical protein
MAQTVDILVRATTSQAQAALGTLSRVFEAIYQDVKKAVDEYSRYAFEIGKAAKLTGITAEEMSRLAQAADDAFVSQEALTRAFQMALKNGFTPTIDNLAKLSDELLAMENPSDRAAAAAKIFGRGWAEIAPFILQGGDAIRKSTDAIADGLIVTDKSVEENIKYKQAVDNLNDQMQALSYTAGKTLVPALTQVLIVTTNLLTIYDREAVTVDNLEQMLLKVPPAYREVERERLNNIIAAKALIDLIGPETEGIAGYNGVLENTSTILGNVSGATNSATGALAGYNLALGAVARLNDDIAAAQGALNDAQESWRSGAGNDTRTLLEAQGLKGEELRLALEQVDKVMGTGLTNQYDYNKNLEEAVKLFDPKNPDAFKDALERVRGKFEPLDKKIQETTLSLEAMQKKALELDGMVINMIIDVQQRGGITIPGYEDEMQYQDPSPTQGGGGGGGGGGSPPTLGPLPYNPQGVNININAGGYSKTDALKLGQMIAGNIQGRR